jgi:hypothetical protein
VQGLVSELLAPFDDAKVEWPLPVCKSSKRPIFYGKPATQAQKHLTISGFGKQMV